MAFDLYATLGLPLEITRDIAREQGLDVDEAGFHNAMEDHRLASGAGKAFGPWAGRMLISFAKSWKTWSNQLSLRVLPTIHIGRLKWKQLFAYPNVESGTTSAAGDEIEVLLPRTCFYIESGDRYPIRVGDRRWEMENTRDDVRKPAAGVIVTSGR